MRMQSKLTVTLLICGLLSAGTVGGIAYWLLMRDFHESVMDHAYENFQQDITEYLETYGGWQAAAQQEPFHSFVRNKRRHLSPPNGQIPGLPPPTIDRHQQAPFAFLVLDPSGRVVKPLQGYPVGMLVNKEILDKTRPVIYQGATEILIAPIGEPRLTPRDKGYIEAMRQALTIGIMVAVLIAILIGLIFGQRISASLRQLTLAMKAMKSDRELQHQVDIRSQDEVGELAAAFNQMNEELSRAHRELRESHDLVAEQANQLKELSIRDPLTHLFNRRHFDEQAQTLFEHSVRYEHPLSIMVGDLDHFKQINDQFSHAVGDQVLRQVASLLTDGIRKSDVVARYGGEEFVILFPNASLAQAAHCCEGLRERVENYPWHQIHVGLSVTMSMGLSDELQLGNVEKMIAQADDRLYSAKHGGRNRIVPAAGVAA